MLMKTVCASEVFLVASNSGVSGPNTSHIFLESAWFDPSSVRKSSFRHESRTDAATHFEKGVDISNTVEVLKRAAFLITGEGWLRLHPHRLMYTPFQSRKKRSVFTYAYLKKLSGKAYSPSFAV